MSATESLPGDDPLHRFPTGAFLRDTTIPVPLTGTRFAVTIRDGMAMVETERTFRNADHRSIEVTLTMPMPVRAVLYDIVVKNDGRTLRASCLPRNEAVGLYEKGGVTEGKLAVLHEEVLCGVHKVSVANIPPGSEISIKSTWATFLVPSHNGRAGFRIPLTVGDIYGRSPLSDADDLISGEQEIRGSLSVDGDGDVAILSGGRPVAARVDISLDRPLDFSVPVRPWTGLSARAHDGRRISLSLKPGRARDLAIDAAVLIDRSGSMDSPCISSGTGPTKFEAVRAGLTQAAQSLTGADRLHLFAFDNHCEALGVVSTPADCTAALATAGEPRGGTEIGASLRGVLARGALRDIVLITDGKSHALDISGLLLSGRRFTVVLIGDDSLEARVGELAVSSGGALLVAQGHAVAEAVTAALATVRSPHTIGAVLERPLRGLTAQREGLEIEARWTDDETPAGPMSDAVRALATALALPRLSEADATELAVAEGLVGRLTSLVLVDEASQRQEGLPVTYKLSLAEPALAAGPPDAARVRHAFPGAVASDGPPMMPAPAAAAAAPPVRPESPAAASPNPFALPAFLRRSPQAPNPPTRRPTAPRQSSDPRFPWPSIDAGLWNLHGTDLANGNLDVLPTQVAAEIRGFAANPDIVKGAIKLNLPPLLAAIGILARDAGNIWATRVANTIFKGLTIGVVDAVVGEINSRQPPFSRKRTQ